MVYIQLEKTEKRPVLEHVIPDTTKYRMGRYIQMPIRETTHPDRVISYSGREEVARLCKSLANRGYRGNQ